MYVWYYGTGITEKRGDGKQYVGIRPRVGGDKGRKGGSEEQIGGWVGGSNRG